MILKIGSDSPNQTDVIFHRQGKDAAEVLL